MMTHSRTSKSTSAAALVFSLLLILVVRDTVASAADLNDQKAMDIERLKSEAFARCQAPFVAPVTVPVPVLDPPANGQPDGVGLVYQEELAIKTTNLLDKNEFYFLPKPRAALNTIPMDVFVDNDGHGLYQRKTWADANPDYSSSVIQPPIDKNRIPSAGQVLTELIIGHRSPGGDYPQLFDIRSSAYVRFAGFPPQISGASLRLGAHGIFSQGPNDEAGEPEDFPIIRSLYISAPDSTTAHSFILLENKLFCGALRLDLSPTGQEAEILVDSYWYTREDFQWKKDPHTGLVAYSSMFWKREQQTSNSTTDSAHDSDTMFVKYADGSQARYPIALPINGLDIHDLTKSLDTKPVIGWSLENDDRDPTHYADFAPALGSTNYNFRVSYGVDILESNIQTGVSLYEHATDVEYEDNIVAISTLRQDIKKAKSVDQFVHFKYKTTAYYPETAPAPIYSNPDECEFIRQEIKALPTEGGVIHIPAGTFNCQEKIVLKKSHVKVLGAGRDQTTLRLLDYSENPVLVLGDDQVIQDTNGNWITASRITDVEVSDLTVDGNLVNQDVHHECGKGSCDGDISDIRNNAITIRGASYVTLNRVTVHDAISGGLVTEKYCDHLHLTDFTSYGNHFDGFAGYQTENSLFENINLSRNHGAGISIDIQFNNNTFSGGTIAGNGDAGIFSRASNNDVFENLTIIQSGNHGAFLEDWGVSNTCSNNNEFRSVTISGSKGYGIDIASACTGDKVTENSILENNTMGCYHVNPSTTMNVSPFAVCRKGAI